MQEPIDRRELLRRGALGLGALTMTGILGVLLPSSDRLASRGGAGPTPTGGRRRPGSPFVSALDQGCDPTGSTVCTSGLNTMLAAAAGGTAWLDPGTYLFDGSLRLPSRTTLAGPGRLRLVDHARDGGADAALSVGDGSVVRDVTIDGNKARQRTDRPLILAARRSGVQIVGATIEDAAGRSIFCFQCTGVLIDGCTIRGGGLTEATDSTRAAILTLGSSHVWIAGNTITSSAGEAVALSANEATVTNNRIRDPHGIAIAVGTGQRSVLIADNEITVTETWRNPRDGLLWPNCIDVGESTDCRVVTNRTAGGACGVANAPPSFRTSVIGNDLRGAAMWGVAIGGWAGRGPTGAEILDNTCVGNALGGIVLPYATSSTVAGNVCTNNGQDDASGRGAGITVYGDERGGYVDGLVVAGNRCGSEPPGPTQQYGLRVQGRRNTNVQVVDNDFRDNAQGGVLDDAAPGNVRYSGNQGAP